MLGTERQASMTRPYFKQIATLSSKYKKIIFPFLHPESNEATSEAVSLHSFCIRASPVSRCTLQVGPSVDGLLCNTCLTSTCGSKVHRVPFVSPLVVPGGHQRLVSQLLSSVNTSVDGSERRNERGGGCPILTGSSPSITCATLRHSEGHGCLWQCLCELLPGGDRSEELLYMAFGCDASLSA